MHPAYTHTATSIRVAARNAKRGNRCGARTPHTRNARAKSGATRIRRTENAAHVANGDGVAFRPTANTTAEVIPVTAKATPKAESTVQNF